MRMKSNKSSQLLLVSAASLLAAILITACGSATVDFVYVTSAKAAGTNNYGEIDVFEINGVSGFMRQIRTSPFPSGGRNPVAEALSSDNTNLYVVNQDDNTIVQFLIGNDGKVYPQNTVNTPGIYPLAAVVSGSNLFVLDTYQPLPSCSNAAPCSGSVGVFPLSVASGSGSSATLGGAPGTPLTNTSIGEDYWPLILPSNPTHIIVPTAIKSFGKNVDVSITAGTVTGGVATFTANQSAVAGNLYILSGFTGAGSVLNGQLVTVLSTGLSSTQFEANVTGISSGTTGAGNADWGEFVYVTAYDSTVTPNIGYVFGFSIDSSGELTPLNGGVPHDMGVGANGLGIHPSAIASDSTSTYVYVTDSTNGIVVSYSIASGVLTKISDTTTGNQPTAIVVDSAYPYAYVANGLDGTVSAYSIGSNGALARIGTYDTGIQPVAIGIDPSNNHFVFTANFLGNNVSDFELSTTAGTLTNAQLSPYTSNAQPTAVVAVPHGSTQ